MILRDISGYFIHKTQWRIVEYYVSCIFRTANHWRPDLSGWAIILILVLVLVLIVFLPTVSACGIRSASNRSFICSVGTLASFSCVAFHLSVPKRCLVWKVISLDVVGMLAGGCICSLSLSLPRQEWTFKRSWRQNLTEKEWRLGSSITVLANPATSFLPRHRPRRRHRHRSWLRLRLHLARYVRRPVCLFLPSQVGRSSLGSGIYEIGDESPRFDSLVF